ncbi:MAG TPA: glycosyltransferase [Candidatus Acidoferrales bacterium]|nr:glycosyltransferase [Candidatus Acidoferrales bacterium]
MDVSIIICTHNRSASLQDALASLKQLSVPTGLGWEFIFVDNNSSDNTRQIIEEFAQSSGFDVRYVFEPKQGLSFARNAGIRRAQGAIIAFTDDDVIVDPRWLVELNDAFAHFDCIAVAGRIVPIWNQPRPAWLEMEDHQAVVHFDLGQLPKEIDSPPVGANMAFRRIAFEKYGLFQARLGVNKREIAGSEDDEIGKRLLRVGEKIAYAPKAVIYHPVESHRLTKSYLLRWHYSQGKAAIRARTWPQDAVRYFGVPRYLFRSLLLNCFKWAVTFDEKRRFQHKLRTYKAAGGIREALRLREAPPTEIPRL